MELGIREAKNNLSKLVQAALEREEVYLTKGGERAVQIIAVNNRPLPRHVKRLMEETTTELFVSVVSAWEIVMKAKLGHSATEVEQAIRGVDAMLLPIKFLHLDILSSLPSYEHHQDPFDRMLIAQALAEGLPIVTSNMHFDEYKGLHVIWE